MECCSLLYWLLDDDGARRDVVRKCRKSLFFSSFITVSSFDESTVGQKYEKKCNLWKQAKIEIFEKKNLMEEGKKFFFQKLILVFDLTWR